MKTVAVGTPEPGQAGAGQTAFPVGALRVVRWSAHYDQTVVFYRDAIGLPVLETFHRQLRPGRDDPGPALRISASGDRPLGRTRRGLAPGLDRLVCRPRVVGPPPVLTTLALDLP